MVRASGQLTSTTGLPTVVVGAGAAGLATAIFIRQIDPLHRVVLVDGATRLGAKILVSGGGRCNVTNVEVTERDYWGGKRTIIRRVLRALTVQETVAFFSGLGVPLVEDYDGKLFPVSNRARDVLDGLLAAARATGVELSPGTRIHAVEGSRGSFTLTSSRGPLAAGSVVLATGGLSLPKTGSDGVGLDVARRFGHTIVPTTPALAPLVLGSGFHADVSGVSHDAALSIWVEGRRAETLRGSLLWTHFGLSGPLALNASRHILRAELEGCQVAVTLNFTPDETFETVDARWEGTAQERPRAQVQSAMPPQMPASVSKALLDEINVDGGMQLSELTREVRRRLAHATTALPLDVTGSRGYNFAEATAGGVALDEIDPATMMSRKCAGLFLVGEMLDVDGRIGGFNFQWAWSSARAAARGVTRDR